MPVLQPPPLPDQQSEPEDLPFVRIRDEVHLLGNTEAVQALRDDTRSHLELLQISWPSIWGYFS